ncbi:MAG: hypothetical protein Q9191_005883 [Dirinaria sp. TL-2023a]
MAAGAISIQQIIDRFAKPGGLRRLVVSGMSDKYTLTRLKGGLVAEGGEFVVA